MADDLADRTDVIWHRALDVQPASGMPGDVAIWAVLLFHGTAMNGGVLHAVESNDEAEVTAAMDGYRWLGLTDVADLIAEVRRAVALRGWRGLVARRGLEAAADKRYHRTLPNDSDLEAALLRKVAASPEAFTH